MDGDKDKNGSRTKQIKNVFTGLARDKAGEVFESLLETDAFRLERIVSTGQATPPGEWYDQDRDEWVVLLSGQAGVVFEGSEETVVLGPGDHLLIPAHEKHRVAWTASGTETTWLALHFMR